MTQLFKKEEPYVWGSKQEEAFQKLKELLISAPILALPDTHKEYFMYTDASIIRLGAILLQKDSEGFYHAITYLSRGLTKAEKNYSTTELECLGMVWACKKL